MLSGENQQAFAHFEVERRGYLDVLFVALNHCYRHAECLNHGCVVGKVRAIGLLVGAFKQLQVEGLWGLHQSIGIAVHGLASAIGHHLAQCFYHRRYGYHGLGLSGHTKTTFNNRCRHHRAHAIVHRHHALGIVGDECQAITNRLETRCSAVGQEVRQVKVVRSA